MVLKSLLFIALIIGSAYVQAQLNYPSTRKSDHVDTYHGTTVPDPYRWLENDTSSETAAWVKNQNELTFSYLEKIPFRDSIRNRVKELFNYPKYNAPFRNNEYFYFYRNDGLQNQYVLYRQKGLDGKTELVIDPNTLSPDGTTALKGFVLSKNGHYATWGVSRGGSDWQTYYVRDMRTGKDLSDSLNWVKVSGIAWQGDGFYYSRYPSPGGESELSSKNENHQVWYHKAGTSQDQDILVFEDPSNPQRFHILGTSEDEDYAFLSISDRGKGFDGVALWYRKGNDPRQKFTPLVKEVGEFDYGIVDVVNDKFLVHTNHHAKNWKLVLIDPANPEEKNWKTIIAEKPEPLQDVSAAGGRIFARYLKDVTTRVYVHDSNGKLLSEVKMPAPGSAGGFGGKKEDSFVFYTFSAHTYPPTVFKYDIRSGKSEVFSKPELKFDPADFKVSQVFYKSKDGTRVPMFIIHKKGLKKNGNNPTLLYAYGGFNISILPGFNSSLVAWLERGGVYAVASIRGGAEYGEQWHEQGMRLKKQNVFDDFIAAGEYLVKEKFASPSTLGIIGGSNGGLLVGAVMNQRPDLFKVAIPQVGVMDMLRFHKFTIGWNWIAEYGSSDEAESFKNLYAYSPLHNIKKGVSYPATLVTTADHDDRVVPAHSFKYAATLQENHAGNNPVLIRIDTQSGHGSSNTSKAIDLIADIYSFALYNMTK